MLATDVRDHSEQALIGAKTSWHVRFRNIKKQPQACESESVLVRLTPVGVPIGLTAFAASIGTKHNQARAPARRKEHSNVTQQDNNWDCGRYSFHRTCCH